MPSLTAPRTNPRSHATHAAQLAAEHHVLWLSARTARPAGGESDTGVAPLDVGGLFVVVGCHAAALNPGGDGSRCGLGGLGEFWPDALPVVWAQVAAGDGAGCGRLDGGAVHDGDAARSPVRDSLRALTDRFCELCQPASGFASLVNDFVHGAMLNGSF